MSGSKPYIVHKPTEERDEDKPLYYYATATLNKGEKLIAYMSEKVMDKKYRSEGLKKAGSNGNSPWKLYDEEMCKKVILKKLLSPLPVFDPSTVTGGEEENLQESSSKSEGLDRESVEKHHEPNNNYEMKK